MWTFRHKSGLLTDGTAQFSRIPSHHITQTNSPFLFNYLLNNLLHVSALRPLSRKSYFDDNQRDSNKVLNKEYFNLWKNTCLYVCIVKNIKRVENILALRVFCIQNNYNLYINLSQFIQGVVRYIIHIGFQFLRTVCAIPIFSNFCCSIRPTIRDFPTCL
jgi:hypothetical protein